MSRDCAASGLLAILVATTEPSGLAEEEIPMKSILALGCGAAATLFSLLMLAQGAPEKSADRVRKFEFTYSVTVKSLLPEDRRVRVWIPLAMSDANQEVLVKNISSPVPTRMTRDKEYGDRMLYAEIRNPKDPVAAFTLQYEITRKEYS